MVKHVILWTLKDELSGLEAEKIKSDIKKELEGLVGKIPGLIEMRILTDCLSSSTAELMLDSTFEDAAALKGYSVHPDHVAVANVYVRPYTAIRSCFDYEL